MVKIYKMKCLLYHDDFPKEVKFLSSSDDITWGLAFTELVVCYVLMERGPCIKPGPARGPAGLRAGPSPLNLGRQGSLCELAYRWAEHSHGCFVRISCDGCCFNLFSPHVVFFFSFCWCCCFYFLFFLKILSPFSSLWLFFQLVFSHCDTLSWQSGMDVYMTCIAKIVK